MFFGMVLLYPVCTVFYELEQEEGKNQKNRMPSFQAKAL